jgi:hypothetical protein
MNNLAFLVSQLDKTMRKTSRGIGLAASELASSAAGADDEEAGDSPAPVDSSPVPPRSVVTTPAGKKTVAASANPFLRTPRDMDMVSVGSSKKPSAKKNVLGPFQPEPGAAEYLRMSDLRYEAEEERIAEGKKSALQRLRRHRYDNDPTLQKLLSRMEDAHQRAAEGFAALENAIARVIDHCDSCKCPCYIPFI